MNDIDERVRQAFDAVQAPEHVKLQTLSFIEAARKEERPCTAACLADVEPLVKAQPVDPAAARSTASDSASVRMAAARVGKMHGTRFRRALTAFAACIALAAICLGGYGVYQQPTAYVGIDVNPSVELSINRFGIVVGAKAINSDGRALLQNVSLERRGYADALAVLTESSAFEPYVQEDSFIEISVTSDNDKQADDLQVQSDALIAQLPCQGECAVVDGATRDAASAAGMGVGRYRAARQLVELDPAITLDECSHMSMRQLRDRIASLGGQVPEVAGSSGPGKGSGYGEGRGQGSGNGAGRGSAQNEGGGAGQGAGFGQGWGAAGSSIDNNSASEGES